MTVKIHYASVLILSILCCLFAKADEDVSNPIDTDKTFLRLTEGQTSGCYSLGDSPEKYEKCMDARGWNGIKKDIQIASYCGMLKPGSQRRTDCFAVGIIVTSNFPRVINKQNDAALDASYKLELAKGPLCFYPKIEDSKYRSCLDALSDEGLIKAEMARLGTLQSDYLSHVDTGYVRDADGNYLEHPAIDDPYDIQKFINLAQSYLDEKFPPPEDAESKAEDARYAAMTKQNEEDRLREAEREKSRRKACGKDYESVRIGMTESRLRKCSYVGMVGAQEGGQHVYRNLSGILIKVVNGTVVSWWAL